MLPCLVCPLVASNYANSYLIPISFRSRSGCWPFLGLLGTYLVVQACYRMYLVFEAFLETQSACYRGPKPQQCPKWLGEGAKGVLAHGPKNLWHWYKRGLHWCKTGLHWCKTLSQDLFSSWSKHLLHPLLTTLGTLEVSDPCSRHSGSQDVSARVAHFCFWGSPKPRLSGLLSFLEPGIRGLKIHILNSVGWQFTSFQTTTRHFKGRQPTQNTTHPNEAVCTNKLCKLLLPVLWSF